MLADERRTLIMNELHRNGIVKVKELSEKFETSSETIRRDINLLERKNLVNKVYGGAVLAGSTIKDSLYSSRETLHAKEKAAIGKLAASLIHDQNTIILGSGTTTLEIAKNIKHLHNLTVITNSIPVILELLPTGMNIFCTGGAIGAVDLNMSDAFALNALKNYHVDMAFITALGITQQAGVTCYTPEESLLAKQIQHQARQTVLAIDSSKFDHNSLVVQGQIHDYDIIITDSNVSTHYITDFANNDINLMVAQV